MRSWVCYRRPLNYDRQISAAKHTKGGGDSGIEIDLVDCQSTQADDIVDDISLSDKRRQYFTIVV